MRFDEDALSKRNSRKSVGEVSDLPFQTHAEIRNAVANGSHVLDVSYVAARELSPFVRSYGGRLANLMLAFAPLAIIIAIVSLALWQGRYLLLIGVPIVLIAHVFSHPMNPLRRPMTALCYILVLASLFALWSRNQVAILFLGAFILPFVANREMYSGNVRALRAALLQSEPLFIDQHSKGTLRLRSTHVRAKQNGEPR